MVSRKTLAYGLTANVVVLGFVSLFTDVSSEMILPILPFFLIQVLSATALIVGLVDGVAESVGTFSKIFSGRLSDSAAKRKRVVAAGYGLSTSMKLLFPFAQSWPEFLGMRILERTGKGVRDAPRDALLTESTPPETRGKAFGFHRSMDTAGAIAGPIITLGLLATVATGLSREGAYRLILLLAAIPALVSVLVILFVREPSRTPTQSQPLRVAFRGIPKPLLVFLGIASLFSFADFSYVFLLLRAGTLFDPTAAILLYVLYNRSEERRVGKRSVTGVQTCALPILVILFVREPSRTPTQSQPLRVAFRGIPKPLLVFLGIASLFSFADFSYVFLLLRAGTLFDPTEAILLYVLYNVVYAAHAFPAGILSDRVGRKPVVLIGYIAFIAMSTLLVVSGDLLVLVAAFILYGLSYGMAEGTQRAPVAGFAPAEIKATVSWA